MTTQHFDYIIIGAGIAGTSAAMRLSEFGSVALLEREEHPGYHSTGRSAAAYEPTYGPAKVLPLIAASGDFLKNPPAGFCSSDLLKKRGSLSLFKDTEKQAQEEMIGILELVKADYEVLNFEQARAHVPILSPQYTSSALYSDILKDLDVDALHQGYMRSLKANGGSLIVNAEVTGIDHADDWTVDTPAGTFSAPVLINAAGAWADVIGGMAGAKSVGLQPKRRTALLAKMPEEYDVSTWPMTGGMDPAFYFKPDAGHILLSPEDQTPIDPCDAWPEDLDLAYAIDRFENVTTVSVGRPKHTWAGLRSFVADEGMVAGYDADKDGFFWLCGQGGFGIETSPVMSLIASQLVRGKGFPQEIIGRGVTEADLNPARLR